MKSRRSLILLLLIAICSLSKAQPFMKVFKLPNRPDILGIIRTGNSGYAFITDRRMLLLDQQGEKINEWTSDGFPDASLQKIIRTTTGKFYITALKGGKPGFYLFILTAAGTLERTVAFEFDEVVGGVDIAPGLNGNFFLTYLMQMPGKPNRLFVQHMSEGLQELWKRDVSPGVFYLYSLLTAPGGGLEIAYGEAGEVITLKTMLFSEQGDRSEKNIVELWSEGELEMGILSSRTADGGYLFGCTENIFEENAEVILLKADAAGKVQWRKNLDIHRNDMLIGLHSDAIGTYILTESGQTQNWQDESGNSDMALTALDADGNILWRKAFGAAHGDDYATSLLVAGDDILIGGYAWVLPDLFGSSILIKTGRDGHLRDHPFPHALQPASSIQPVPLSFPSRTKQLVSSVQTPDGGYISSAKVMGTTDRDFVACIFRTNAQGQIQWVKFPSDRISSAAQIRKTTDGNYVMLLTEYDINKFVSAVKFSPDGNVLWSKLVWSLYIEDIVATPDGGYMITGGKFNNQVQNNAFLTKLDANGDEVWQRVYEYPDRSVIGKHIRLTNDQKIVVAGSANRFTGSHEEIYFLMTELDGMPVRAQVLGKSDSIYSIQCILPAENNQVLLGGYARALQGSDQNLLLMKINRGGSIVWKNQYNISLQDQCTNLIPLGDTAYCLAGTTGVPLFGTRKQIGFLANIKLDGTNNAIRYFGNSEGSLRITNIYEGNANKLFFTANRQDEYGVSQPVTGSFDPGVVLSSGEQELARSVQLFPNPANEFANLSITNQYAGSVRIAITDSKGSVYKKIEWRKSAGAVSIPLSLFGMASGIYQVEISMGKSKVLKRLVIIP
jgi:hypothetical protein